MSAALRAYRRCHVCGNTCEGEGQIRRCTKCNKAFAPFFYFNDRHAPVHNASGLRPPGVEGEWRPIHGLTAYWQPD